ncbi:MAG: hypothetical protein AAGD25_07890 [Cyanobacteria bacterium P01_F01_bin.150]
MARQYRWFLGFLLVTFISVLWIGTDPFSQPSSAAPSPSFTDPNNQYSIALLEGFKAHLIAGKSIFESPDGEVAYSVIVSPTLSNSTLTDAALAQIAQVTFQQGEGFAANNFQSLNSGGIKIEWTGQVTTRKTQPLSGAIFVRQFDDSVFLLMLAATEAGQQVFAEAIATLPASLKPLPQ